MSELQRVHRSMDEVGYALSNLGALGLSSRAEFCDHVVGTYFTSEWLGYYNDTPATRQRGPRDVIRYAWHGDELEVDEHTTTVVGARVGFKAGRVYPRAYLLKDRVVAPWIRLMISLVPPSRRQPMGTFAVNALRTHGQIVEGPHQDEEDLIYSQLLRVEGVGGTSHLYEPGKLDKPVFSVTLGPEDVLLSDDERYWHGVTDLQGIDGKPPVRDALVCTMNYPATYPLP